jgi:hypothetical protein
MWRHPFNSAARCSADCRKMRRQSLSIAAGHYTWLRVSFSSSTARLTTKNRLSKNF